MTKSNRATRPVHVSPRLFEDRLRVLFWRDGRSANCIAEKLHGGWTLFFGDSTQRSLYTELLALLRELGFRCNEHGPSLGGGAHTFAQEHRHKDYDTHCSRPASGTAHEHVLSFRFLRGFDQQKLKLNARNWTQRYLYTGWNSAERWKFGTQVLMESDHDDTKQLVTLRREPSAVLFHAAAWVIPKVTRATSGLYKTFYTDTSWSTACDAGTPRPATFPVTMLKGASTHVVEARVVPGTACKFKTAFSSAAPDEAIYQDAKAKLSETLKTLRASFKGHLWVRSIFSGIQDVQQGAAQKQFEQMARLDRIARHVARQSCLGVLDVYEVNRAAGFYEHIGPEDFHSPPSAERHAATAMLLWLMELPEADVP